MNIGGIKKWLVCRTISFWFTVGFFAMAIAGVGTALAYWDAIHPDRSYKVSPIETIRNVGLVVGGGLAFVFAWWRALVAERQADAARSQVETAQNQADIALRTLSYERYQRGAEMLGSPTLAVRLGGIYALQQLAAENPHQYHVQTVRLLSAFVRNPTKDEVLDQLVEVEGEVMPKRIREDAQAALSAIGTRSSIQVQIEIAEGFTVDLQRANLHSADLRGCNLDRADLTDATLESANLEEATFRSAHLVRADLTSARLTRAGFKGAICVRAQFRGAIAREADFRNADLEGTIWSDATLNDADFSFSTLKGALFARSRLMRAVVSGAVLGLGRRRMEMRLETSLGEDIGITYTEVHTWMTQAQLDQTKAADDCPPSIEPGTTDFESDSELVWKGGSVP